MAELYEIDLCSYRNAVEDTRLMISEVTSAYHPFNISTDIDQLVQKIKSWEDSRSVITRNGISTLQRLREAKVHFGGYPFMGTAKLRGTHFTLVIRKVSRDSLEIGDITVQTTNLFDLVKGHASNSGFLDFLLRNHGEILGVVEAFVARFKNLHQLGAETYGNHPIVLSGVSNPRQFYAMREVRSPGFVIHSLNINGEWQSLCNYYHLTGDRRSRTCIYTVANTHHTPWIFLKPGDGGRSFMEQATRIARELATKDHLYKATCGMIFTPAPPSGFPTDGRLWFKKTAVDVSHLDVNYLEHVQFCRKLEAERHERLRAEAQAFVEQICTEDRLEKAWNTVLQIGANGHAPDRTIVAPFMAEMHRLERLDFDDDDWSDIDWTKAFPRIDRIAKAWALAKLRSLDIATDHPGGDEWVDVMDEETALENTYDLRQGADSTL